MIQVEGSKITMKSPLRLIFSIIVIFLLLYCNHTPKSKLGELGKLLSILLESRFPNGNVTIKQENGKLFGSYLYTDPNEYPEEGSTCEWIRITDAKSLLKKACSAEKGSIYDIELDVVNKDVMIRVTLQNSKGKSIIINSNAYTVTVTSVTPIAKDVIITGTNKVGNAVQATYTFEDPSNYLEKNSICEWFRKGTTEVSIQKDTACKASTGSSYTIQDQDIGMELLFKVTPENEKTIMGQTVTSSYGIIKSNKAAIETFYVNEIQGIPLSVSYPGVINFNIITVNLPLNSTRNSLKVSFVLSSGATSDKLSGTTYDFTTPQTFLVTAEDGVTTQNYTVTVTNTGIESIPTLSNLTITNDTPGVGGSCKKKTHNSVTLFWTKASDAQDLYYRIIDVNTGLPVNEAVNGVYWIKDVSTLKAIGLTPYTPYTFKVQVRDTDWNMLEYNNTSSILTYTSDAVFDSCNGTISNASRNQTWIKCTIGQNWNSNLNTCDGSHSSKQYCDQRNNNCNSAIIWILDGSRNIGVWKACNDLNSGGGTDWRALNHDELRDFYTNIFSPNVALFPNMVMAAYFSSQSFDSFPWEFAFGVHMQTGNTVPLYKDDPYPVICSRTGL